MPIDHIVVLMLENRSFDNVLGGLYSPDNAPPYQQPPPGQAGFDGVPTGAYNPGPTGFPFYAHNQTTPTWQGASGPYAPTAIPAVDPGELFGDMAQQYMGLDELPGSMLWGTYSPAGPSAAMGYVKNYAQLGTVGSPLYTSKDIARPLPENYHDVMNYFTPAQMPVSAFLANRYGISDTWHCSVPAQTYVNRSFALSAAPAVAGGASFVDDPQYFKVSTNLGNPPLEPIDLMPTIFSQLDQELPATGASGPYWKVYFHDYSITYDTLQYVREKVATGQNVGTFDDSDWNGQTPTQLGSNPVASSFAADVINGVLPPLSWIEPRYFENWAPSALPPNSNHPGTAAKLFVKGSSTPIDAAAGEVLLMQVYNMLQASPLWQSTLLIVTYDENCGIWDHVPPPFATPPGPTTQFPPASYVVAGFLDMDPAAKGFDYTVFGGRVPAIVVGPQVPPGSAFRAQSPPFDHTSIIRTVRDVFLAPLGATAPLSDRDAAAPSLVPGLTGAPPNDAGPFQGTIVAGPGALVFGPGYPAPQYVFTSAGPGYPLQATPTESWLSLSVSGGMSVSETTPYMITVNTDSTGLTAGSYAGQIQITSTGATAAVNSPLAVPVQFTVT